MLKVGCCGWGYLNPKEFGIDEWKKQFKSKLQCYASLFDLVEVNSTFYKIPQIKTAEKWREEVDEVNKKFEFTVKCSQIVTHQDQFKGKRSIEAFDRCVEICNALKAKIFLLQTPASFKASEENLKRVEKFFSSIERRDLILVWEVRGKSWRDEIVRELFSKHALVHCTDPFAAMPAFYKEFAYFRLHGSPPGKKMYYYDYTESDLRELKEKLGVVKARYKYVLFNNIWMYKSAHLFLKL